MSTAALYDATVTHQRSGPVRHRFRHGTSYWLVDLDALDRLPWWARPFARFDPRDHLSGRAASIRADVDAFLARDGAEPADRVLMLTQPRTFGYVFNPITVFWCRRADGRPAAVIAEVHNTYGDRHAYLLHPDASGAAEVDKAMYVSPFNDVRGRYRIRVGEPGARLQLSVVLDRAGHEPFVAALVGRRRALRPSTLLGSLLRHPWAPLRTSALIRWHGARLWLRGLAVVPRPVHHQPGVR